MKNSLLIVFSIKQKKVKPYLTGRKFITMSCGGGVRVKRELVRIIEFIESNHDLKSHSTTTPQPHTNLTLANKKKIKPIICLTTSQCYNTNITMLQCYKAMVEKKTFNYLENPTKSSFRVKKSRKVKIHFLCSLIGSHLKILLHNKQLNKELLNSISRSSTFCTLIRALTLNKPFFFL